MYNTKEEKNIIAQNFCNLINFNFELELLVDEHNTIYGSYIKGGCSLVDGLRLEIYKDSIYVFWWGKNSGDWNCKNIQEVLLCINIYLKYGKTKLFLEIPDNN